MDSWSLAVDFGSGPAHSQVSVNAGRMWTADYIGYLDIGNCIYIVRLHLVEGIDLPPPAIVHEHPDRIPLGCLGLSLPSECFGGMPELQRVRLLATWTAT